MRSILSGGFSLEKVDKYGESAGCFFSGVSGWIGEISRTGGNDRLGI